MSSTQVLALVLIVTWLAGGAIVAVLMHRSGHDLRLWLGLGVLLGPFAALFAADRLRHLPRRGAIASDDTRRGGLDLLAGIDDSTESVAAAKVALELNRQITSLTLATVLDYDSSGPFSGIDRQARAYGRLVDVADEIGYQPVELKLLFGRPSKEIATFARDAGMELIVVGARGHGMSRALLGSVSSELIGTSTVPIFVGPSNAHSEEPATLTGLARHT